MPEQVLSLVIKVSKEGEADKQVVQSLERMQKQTLVTSGGMDSLRMVSSRASETLLRQIGVNEQVIRSLKLLELGHKASERGVVAMTLAAGGLVAAVGGAVTIFQHYARELDAAGAQEIQSARDLNWVLENGIKLREKVMAQREKEARIAENLRDLAVISGRGEDIQIGIGMGAELAGIERGRAARLLDFQRRQSQIGAGALGNIATERTKILQAERAAVAEINAEYAVQNEKLEALQKQHDELLALREREDDPETLKIINAEYERVRQTLRKTADELVILEARRKSILELAGKEKEIALKEIAERERVTRLEMGEKELSLAEQFRSALEDEFILEAKLKGIQDNKVSQAYAYLQATGRAADAQRLITLELEKQRIAAPLEYAGGEIARLGGLNIEAVAGRGATMGERSQLRTLSADFQRDFLLEQRRLRQESNRDEAFIQQQLASFASSRLSQSPTLIRALGLTPPDGKRPEDDEETRLLAAVDISKIRETNARKLKQLGDEESLFFKDFGDYTDRVKRDLAAVKVKLKM